MSNNRTPKTINPLVTRVRVALAGVKALGASVGIKGNDIDAISDDYYDLVGRPADPTATPPVEAIVGKQPYYLERKVVHGAARADYRQAIADGRTFVTNSIDMLRTPLGRQWNIKWASLFVTPSLKLPSDPVPMLVSLEAYFRTHPAHENAVLNLTGARAIALLGAIDTAKEAIAEARDNEVAAKQARDRSWRRLRTRLGLLREELSSLLGDDDSRWYRFGFRRPADGETPDLVDEVTARLGAPGEVVVEWTKARLAENYRVLWKVTDSPDEPTQVGLFTDLHAIITGLPPATNITVSVRARNDAGESAPMEAQIALP